MIFIDLIYIIRHFPDICLFIISEQLSVETNIQERQKPRKTYNRNDDVRPTTEAKVLDFKDKDSTTSMGGNMTDVLVESTYEQLVTAYRSANKVSIKHKCGYTIPNNILKHSTQWRSIIHQIYFQGAYLLFLVHLGPNKLWSNCRKYVLQLFFNKRRKSKNIFQRNGWERSTIALYYTTEKEKRQRRNQ